MFDSTLNNHCYIGLTQWQHSAWTHAFLRTPQNNHPLSHYAQHFSSVEGNTTFYGLPKEDSVMQWNELTDDEFRFCFKFPQSITHQQQLTDCSKDTQNFFDRLLPLKEKIGLLCIQLPASFSANELDALAHYLDSLPKEFSYAVEVRHTDFFAKGSEERELNQLLHQHQVNRISFDTRALFAHPAQDSVSLNAKQHKPRLPVHAITTGDKPMVRFITPMDWQWGIDYLLPWVAKTCQWLEQGYSPYFFFHTPDNADAPLLANYFANLIEEKAPGKVLFSPFPTSAQENLF